MEFEVNKKSPFLLQKGIQLMLSGTEPRILREILNNYIKMVDAQNSIVEKIKKLKGAGKIR